MNKLIVTGISLILVIVGVLLSPYTKGEVVPITISGTEIIVGTTTIGELEQKGFKLTILDTNSKTGYSEVDTMLNTMDKRSWMSQLHLKKDGGPLMWIEVVNETEEALPIRECIISKIKLHNLDGEYSKNANVIINEFSLVGANNEYIKTNFPDMKVYTSDNTYSYTKGGSEYSFKIGVRHDKVYEIEIDKTLNKNNY